MIDTNLTGLPTHVHTVATYCSYIHYYVSAYMFFLFLNEMIITVIPPITLINRKTA